MRIAGSIILGVVGAILYFAVTADVQGVSLDMVGIILMVAAAIWFLIELVVGFTGLGRDLDRSQRRRHHAAAGDQAARDEGRRGAVTTTEVTAA